MVLLTIHARGSTDSQTELTLTKIHKGFKEPAGTVEYGFTVTSTSDITNISTIVLNVKTATEETNYENSNVSQIDASGNTTIPFQVTEKQFKVGTNVTLFLTVHDTTQQTLAFLEEEWTPQDIHPQLTWVGSSNNSDHKNSLRVQTDVDITLDDHQCNNDSSPCYFLHYQGESPFEICTEAKLDNLTFTSFSECDTTITANESSDLSHVKEILLTRKSGGNADLEIDATYGWLPWPSKTMEIRIYDESNLTIHSTGECKIQNRKCTVQGIIWESQEPLCILMVVLNDIGHVTKSNEIRFEDYKTEAQLLTNNTVEIRWSSSQNLSFVIKLQENTAQQDTEITNVSLTCGENDNAKCKAYFLELTETKKYTASVTYLSDTNVLHTVATEIEQELPPGIPYLTITRFTELDPGDYTVTLSSPQKIDVKTIYLAIINSTEAAKLIETIQYVPADGQLSEAERNFNFTIDMSLLALSENLTLVITAYGSEEDGKALGVAIVYTAFEEIIPPTINEVGTNSSIWIRAKTDTLNLKVNGHDCARNSTTYFKMDDDFKEPLNLCREAGENLNSTKMEQCKIDGTIIPLQDSISAHYIELLYPEDGDPAMTIMGSFTKDATKMEGFFYYSDGDHGPLECPLTIKDTESLRNCTFSGVNVDNSTYNILLVALNDKSVTESTAVGFEDYQTNAIGITSDIIQVTWIAEEKTTYDCYLDKEVPDSFDKLYVDCGADEVDRCLAFFTDLVNKTYTVRIKKHQNGDLNVVGRVANMPTL